MLTQTTLRSRHAKIGGRGGGGSSPVLFSCSRFPLSQFSGPDYLSLEQANSDVMDDVMSEKVNEVLKSYRRCYI